MQFTYRLKQAILAVGDVAMFFVGLYLALTVRTLHLPSYHLWVEHLTFFWIIFFLWLVVNFINGLYDVHRQSQSMLFYRRIAEAGIFSFAVGIIFFYLVTSTSIAPKTVLALTVLFGYALSTLWRYLYLRVMVERRLKIRVLLLGLAPEAQELFETTSQNPKESYRIVAIVDPLGAPSLTGKLPVYTDIAEIHAATEKHFPHLIAIAPHMKENEHALKSLY